MPRGRKAAAVLLERGAGVWRSRRLGTGSADGGVTAGTAHEVRAALGLVGLPLFGRCETPDGLFWIETGVPLEGQPDTVVGVEVREGGGGWTRGVGSERRA